MIEIGKPITEEQQTILNRLLTTREITQVAGKVGLGTTTMNGIIYGTKTITETNIQGLIGLITKANEKVADSLIFFAKAQKELEQFQKETNELGTELLKKTESENTV